MSGMSDAPIIVAESRALDATPDAEIVRILGELLGSAAENIEAALSQNTRRAYRGQWNRFAQWCCTMGLPLKMPIDERILLAYLTHLQKSDKSASTLTQAYSAIREEHRVRGVDPIPRLDGQLFRSWSGARRKAARSRQVVKAKPLTPHALKAVVHCCRGTLGPRDAALLLIGWTGALRREEICALNLSDIVMSDEGGLILTIRQSKTDQMGVGHILGIAASPGEPHCPVAVWQDFVLRHHPHTVEGAEDGWESAPAFPSRTGQRLDPGDVGRILMKRMRQAGLATKGYSAHSLRAGCITAAAQAGHGLEAIQRQSRHKSLEVLVGYIRPATLFQGNVTQGLL
jgi:integrase